MPYSRFEMRKERTFVTLSWAHQPLCPNWKVSFQVKTCEKLSQYTKATMRPALATTVLFRYFPSLTEFLKKLCTTDLNHTSKIMSFYIKPSKALENHSPLSMQFWTLWVWYKQIWTRKCFLVAFFSTLRRRLIRSITVFYLINCTIMELEVLYSSGLRRTWPIEHKQRTLTMTTFHRRRTR